MSQFSVLFNFFTLSFYPGRLFFYNPAITVFKKTKVEWVKTEIKLCGKKIVYITKNNLFPLINHDMAKGMSLPSFIFFFPVLNFFVVWVFWWFSIGFCKFFCITSFSSSKGLFYILFLSFLFCCNLNISSSFLRFLNDLL